LVPSAEVSAIEVLLLEQCRHCGGNLPQEPGQAPTASEPRRHQVTEVPPVKAHITEYQSGRRSSRNDRVRMPFSKDLHGPSRRRPLPCPCPIGGHSPAEVRRPHRHPDIASHRRAWAGLSPACLHIYV
jgi:hypothetical protein